MVRRSLVTSAEMAIARRVSELAFRNPFTAGFKESVGEHHPACAKLVAALEQRGGGDYKEYAGARREVMRTLFLFDTYEGFRGEFDAHIAEQIRVGDAAVRVPFASAVLAMLTQRGCAEDEALRMFAIFFQIRRAYHFIASGLVGASASMQEFRRHLWENVFTHDIQFYERALWNRMEDFSTLLLGETGTGKGTAAAAIGRSGFIPFDPRKQCFAESFMRGFVSINLSQFPETLIESELFGHRKGAFTGAVEAHEGIFARCSPHGAIFLDEIGEVSHPVQIKLLRVLQERVFTPVGSHEEMRFRGRVIAATNRPLQGLRAPGAFREDFYYRLCSDTITIPPLRQRLREEPQELETLLRHILDGVTGGEAEGFQELVRRPLQKLMEAQYAWPGNVRELEQAVRRILLTRRYEGEGVERAAEPAERLARQVQAGTLDADALLAEYCGLLYARSGNLEAVARVTRLDRRTVKRYVKLAAAETKE